DLVAGVVAGPAELVDRVRSTHLLLGSALDPFAAFLLSRGMKTLGLRVARQNDSGARIAAALRTMPASGATPRKPSRSIRCGAGEGWSPSRSPGACPRPVGS